MCVRVSGARAGNGFGAEPVAESERERERGRERRDGDLRSATATAHASRWTPLRASLWESSASSSSCPGTVARNPGLGEGDAWGGSNVQVAEGAGHGASGARRVAAGSARGGADGSVGTALGLSYSGVGLGICRMRDSEEPSGFRLVVVEVLKGGPASRAVRGPGGGTGGGNGGGISPGDFVLSIDGEIVPNADVATAQKMLIGPTGSKVRLSLLSPSSKREYQVQVTRGPASVDAGNLGKHAAASSAHNGAEAAHILAPDPSGKDAVLKARRDEYSVSPELASFRSRAREREQQELLELGVEQTRERAREAGRRERERQEEKERAAERERAWVKRDGGVQAAGGEDGASEGIGGAGGAGGAGGTTPRRKLELQISGHGGGNKSSQKSSIKVRLTLL